MNYIELVEDDKHYLINLDNVGFIDASQVEEVPNHEKKEEFKQDTIYRAYIIIPSSYVSLKIPVYGNTREEAKEKQMAIFNKIFSCISAKQKTVKVVNIQ